MEEEEKNNAGGEDSEFEFCEFESSSEINIALSNTDRLQPLNFIQKKQILIVDDEPFNLQAMMVILKASAAGLGYPPSYIESIVDQELSGGGAYRQVKQNKKRYKLILTDLSMPFMDGYETTKKIRTYLTRKGLRQPVIIACTGHTEQSFIEKAWQYKMNEVLSKPINFEVAKQILSETL